MYSPAVSENFVTTNILVHIKANMMKSLWSSKFADSFQKPIDDKVGRVFHDFLLLSYLMLMHDGLFCYVANLIVVFRMLDIVSAIVNKIIASLSDLCVFSFGVFVQFCHLPLLLSFIYPRLEIYLIHECLEPQTAVLTELHSVT